MKSLRGQRQLENLPVAHRNNLFLVLSAFVPLGFEKSRDVVYARLRASPLFNHDVQL